MFSSQLKLFLFIFLSFLIFGCSEDEVEETCKFSDPTYSFTAEEEELRISYPYFEGQIIKYKSNNNEVLTFKVSEVADCARGYYTGSPGFFTNGRGSLRHTFDSQVIRMILIEHDTSRYGYRNQMHYYVNKSHSSFKRSLNFPLWNLYVGRFGLSGSQNPANLFLRDGEFTDIGSMQVDNVLFNNVIKFDSGSNQIREPNSIYANLSSKINTLYFAEDFGVIRFDEVNGTVWEVEYTEVN
ncbi:hypothetical protein A9Q93_05540 [Nonlabens dokdonensis]|uniref:Lipoprotein n=1 Tax=Nonlabens dokdonensis TaxID=328515 RepID=A0A1Z8B273_9FLAO|nr:hypothetical protein [Nonlabens dokdonensis]OUS16679.1 hypothetical protein A9Q93_05540 [Nonlabens dokdonensis]